MKPAKQHVVEAQLELPSTSMACEYGVGVARKHMT